MQQVRRLAVQRLGDPDNGLYPALLPGGVYDRRLVRGAKTPGNTNAVFITGPSGLVTLQRTIVVLGPNEVDPPDGPARARDFVLRNGFLRLFYYVEANSEGKEALDEIDAKVRQLLDGWSAELSWGKPVMYEALEMSEPIDSEEADLTLVCYRRFSAEYLRPA